MFGYELKRNGDLYKSQTKNQLLHEYLDIFPNAVDSDKWYVSENIDKEVIICNEYGEALDAFYKVAE